MVKHVWVLLACAGLGGCGGGVSYSVGTPPVATDATISGTVSGMPSGLTILLKNNDAETLAVTGSGSFTFTKKVAVGAGYNVTALTQPTGRNCTVSNGSGTVAAGVTSISSVSVSCTDAAVALSSFNVGVTVSGLQAGHSVTFSNGMSTLTADSDGLYVFKDVYYKQVIYAGTPGGYQVVVQTNPAGQTCTLTGAAGALGPGDITNFVNVQAACK